MAAACPSVSGEITQSIAPPTRRLVNSAKRRPLSARTPSLFAISSSALSRSSNVIFSSSSGIIPVLPLPVFARATFAATDRSPDSPCPRPALRQDRRIAHSPAKPAPHFQAHQCNARLYAQNVLLPWLTF